MDINSQVETISSEQLDALFGETNATPTADSLVMGKDDTVHVQSTNEIPFVDNLDDLADEPAPADDKKPEAPVAGDEPAADDKAPEEPKEGDESAPSEDEIKQVNSVLKNTVDFLISKGYWKDFDGREELEIDEETYAELAAKQNETVVSEMFDELVDSTGLYGKAIISHIKQGGNPDEIIDIFKEQKQVQNADLSNVEGQSSLIEKYYSEVVGWNKTKIDKYVNSLRGEEDGLENEAKEIQEKFEKIYEQQVEEIQERENEARQQRAQEQQEYKEKLSQAIDTDENLTDKDKRLIRDSVLKFNRKLEDGTPVNDFYLKFAEIQKDPKQYVKLIHFIMDEEGYTKKIDRKVETKVTAKTWNFVKGNGAVSKRGAQVPTQDQPKTSKIDFSGVLKRK